MLAEGLYGILVLKSSLLPGSLFFVFLLPLVLVRRETLYRFEGPFSSSSESVDISDSLEYASSAVPLPFPLEDRRLRLALPSRLISVPSYSVIYGMMPVLKSSLFPLRRFLRGLV